jgi:hypothetical protein
MSAPNLTVHCQRVVEYQGRGNGLCKHIIVQQMSKSPHIAPELQASKLDSIQELWNSNVFFKILPLKFYFFIFWGHKSLLGQQKR